MLRAIAIASLLAGLAGLAGTASADPPKPAACKRVVVNRHIVCQIDQTIVISVAPPRPSVVIVHRDGKTVTGRPKSGDRLAGLPQHLRD
jgi:hypothetical protein